MRDKTDAEKDTAPTPLDIFTGIKHRLPQTDRELEEWLKSDEGNAATMFASKPVARWGDGRRKT